MLDGAPRNPAEPGGYFASTNVFRGFWPAKTDGVITWDFHDDWG